MHTDDRHNPNTWDDTPLGRLTRQSRNGRRLSLAEALAEVAGRI